MNLYMTVWCNNQLCTIYFNIDTVVWLMVHSCLHYRPKLVNPNPTVCISEHTACISEHYGIFKNKCSFTLNNTELNVAYHSLINNTMKFIKHSAYMADNAHLMSLSKLQPIPTHLFALSPLMHHICTSCNYFELF